MALLDTPKFTNALFVSDDYINDFRKHQKYSQTMHQDFINQPQELALLNSVKVALSQCRHTITFFTPLFIFSIYPKCRLLPFLRRKWPPLPSCPLLAQTCHHQATGSWPLPMWRCLTWLRMWAAAVKGALRQTWTPMSSLSSLKRCANCSRTV